MTSDQNSDPQKTPETPRRTPDEQPIRKDVPGRPAPERPSRREPVEMDEGGGAGPTPGTGTGGKGESTPTRPLD